MPGRGYRSDLPLTNNTVSTILRPYFAVNAADPLILPSSGATQSVTSAIPNGGIALPDALTEVHGQLGGSVDKATANECGLKSTNLWTTCLPLETVPAL